MPGDAASPPSPDESGSHDGVCCRSRVISANGGRGSVLVRPRSGLPNVVGEEKSRLPAVLGEEKSRLPMVWWKAMDANMSFT